MDYIGGQQMQHLAFCTYQLANTGQWWLPFVIEAQTKCGQAALRLALVSNPQPRSTNFEQSHHWPVKG